MIPVPEQPAEGTERTALAIARAADALSDAGVPSARVDAELLTAHVLGVPRSRLVLTAGVGPEQRTRLAELVDARARRVPVQHLTGRAGFRFLELAVGPGVFVPRPETELVAGWGIDRLAGPPAGRRPSAGGGPAVAGGGPVVEPVVLDLCSGSGAIALAVASEVPAARVLAVETDPEALRWLRRNVEDRARAGDRPVQVITGDVTGSGLLTGPGPVRDLRGRVDLVLCNPPYVPSDTPVPPEVAVGDPALAVFGGPDGLAVIRSVIALAAELLRPGGAVAIEHDDSHGTAVPTLLAESGLFVEVADHRDLAGRPRFATAVRAHGKLLP